MPHPAYFLPLLVLAASAHAAEVSLDQLPDRHLSCGWSGRETQAGKAVSGKPITLGDKVFTRGLGTHANSEGTLLLDGRAVRLTGVVGVDASEKPGSVRFLVRGDGKVLFDSGVMRGGEPGKPLDVPLKGVRKLTLAATDAGDGPNHDHADWADVKIAYAGAAPVWIDPSKPVECAEYPESAKRQKSSGGTTWFVDPAKGDDASTGRSSGSALRTFAGVNRYILAPGDTVVVAPGTHTASLSLEGKGTAARPITVKFLPGRHVFAHGALFTEKLHISNTNDRPDAPKAVALHLRQAEFVKLDGAGAEIIAEGKTIYTHLDRCANIALDGLTFDYLNPTVCEFTVVEVGPDYADVRIHPDSAHRIENGRLIWQGAGWEFGAGGYAKVLDPKTGRFGHGFRTDGVKFEVREGGLVRLNYATGKPDLVVGRVIQNRNVTRDCVGFFQAYSRNIAWKNCAIHAIHGMGVVSQFSENLSFENVRVEPRKGSGRTAVTWADILHFSGCRGLIRVKDCVLSCAHDDAINVHGTHLRIVERPAPDKLVVRFIHGQTYGFDAFFPGDEVDFVRHDSLRVFGTNKVKSVRRLDDRRIELTLAAPAPADIRDKDVLENVTWTASVHVSGTTVRNIPTRGFLLTTRRPVIIEKCRFERTGMPAILLEDDASGWFESGLVRDMKITGNTFVECGEPVISIDPQVKKDEGPVHSGITVEGNRFELSGGTAVRSRHSEKIKVGANTYLKNDKPVDAARAVDVK